MKYKEPQQMEVNGTTTLNEAKEWLSRAARTAEGAVCPLTGRFTKVENRPINASMVSALRWMVENSAPGEFIDMPKKAPRKVTTTNQHPTLRHWDLVESMPNFNPAKKRSGMWRVTERGRKFITGGITIPGRAIIAMGVLEKLTGDEISVSQVLTGFNYEEYIRTPADAHG